MVQRLRIKLANAQARGFRSSCSALESRPDGREPWACRVPGVLPERWSGHGWLWTSLLDFGARLRANDGKVLCVPSERLSARFYVLLMRARGSWNGHPSPSHRPYRPHRARNADEVMRFTAILNARTCTCDACIHQSMAARWCSLRRRADDSPRRARGCLRRARRRSFALICTSLHPITTAHFWYRLWPAEPYTGPLLHPSLAAHRPSCTNDPRNDGILVDRRGECV